MGTRSSLAPAPIVASRCHRQATSRCRRELFARPHLRIDPGTKRDFTSGGASLLRGQLSGDSADLDSSMYKLWGQVHGADGQVVDRPSAIGPQPFPTLPVSPQANVWQTRSPILYRQPYRWIREVRNPDDRSWPPKCSWTPRWPRQRTERLEPPPAAASALVRTRLRRFFAAGVLASSTATATGHLQFHTVTKQSHRPFEPSY